MDMTKNKVIEKFSLDEETATECIKNIGDKSCGAG